MSEGNFPPGVSKRGYARTINGLGVQAIASAVRELRPQYIVLANPEPTSDVDLWVNKDTKLLLVIEVKNWSRESDPKASEATRIGKILKKYGVKKLLVTSHHFGIFDYLKKEDVAIIELEFNILPRGWYEYYGGAAEAEKLGMDYFHSGTEEIIKTKLEKYLAKEDM